MIKKWDERLLLAAYNFTAGHRAVKYAAERLAGLSKSFFFVIYALGALWLLWERPLTAVRFLLIPFLTLCYNSFLRRIIGRQRPFVRFGLTPLLGHEANGSCPSNHAASAVIISLAFWLISPYIGVVLLVLAFFTGLSRICAGVHYPLDVAFGWLIGGVVGVIGFILM